MSKILPVIFVAATVFLTSNQYPSPTFAGTCASKCGPQPLQFTPGKRIRVEVLNATTGLVKIEKVHLTDPIPLRPKQELRLENGDGTEPNISLVFWDERGLPLKATVSKPNFGTLRIEIRPNNRAPGDRSVEILDDGRVNIL